MFGGGALEPKIPVLPGLNSLPEYTSGTTSKHALNLSYILYFGFKISEKVFSTLCTLGVLILRI